MLGDEDGALQHPSKFDFRVFTIILKNVKLKLSYYIWMHANTPREIVREHVFGMFRLTMHGHKSHMNHE